MQTTSIIDTFYSREEAEERYANTPSYTDEQVPAGYAGAWHIGSGIFRSRCRECSETVDSYGGVPRWRTIGPHEVAEHGLQVPGINQGLMS